MLIVVDNRYTWYNLFMPVKCFSGDLPYLVAIYVPCIMLVSISQIVCLCLCLCLCVILILCFCLPFFLLGFLVCANSAMVEMDGTSPDFVFLNFN